jgi:phage terminase large subunit
LSSLPQTDTPGVFRPLWGGGRYKVSKGGRGSGKSHDRALHIAIKASSKPGLRVLCIREYQKSLEQSAKFLIESKIDALRLPGFRVLKTHIETPGNGLIVFAGMQNHTADSIKSYEAFDVAWCEEAHTLSQHSLDLLRPTIRKPDSEIWFTYNPDKPTDPVNALFYGPQGPPPGSVLVEANYDRNKFFPDVLRDEMEWDRARDPDKYAHVWAGGYKQSSEARVFHNWTVREFETPQTARFYFGADWGFSVDPSVLVRCWIEGRTLYVDQEAYKIGCPIDSTPALFDTVPGSRQWPLIADSARPETIDYMKRNGFGQMVASKKGAGSVADGVEFLKSFDIVVHPRCKHTADELAFYKYKQDSKTGEILPVLDDKKNHVIDSLRYAVENLRRSKSATRVKVSFG